MGLKERKKETKDKLMKERIKKIGIVTQLGINVKENRGHIYYITDEPL